MVTEAFRGRTGLKTRPTQGPKAYAYEPAPTRWSVPSPLLISRRNNRCLRASGA